MDLSTIRIPDLPDPHGWISVRRVSTPLKVLHPIAQTSLPTLPGVPYSKYLKSAERIRESLSLEETRVQDLGNQKMRISEEIRGVDEGVAEIRECLCSEVGECPLCGRGFP